MGRRLIIRVAAAAGAIAAAAALAWWGIVGTARGAALPPPPPDEGQEPQLYASYLEALVRRRPENWQARVNLGTAYLESGRIPAALAELREAHRVRPNDPDILRALCSAAERAGSIEDQVRGWSALSRIEPGNGEPLIRLAGLYQQLGWISPSLTTIRRALVLAPDDPDALRINAILCYLTDDFPGAIASARRMLRHDSASGVAHSILANCYRDLNRWPDAFAEGEAAVRAAPEVVEFYSNLAQLYMDRPQHPDYARAIAVIQTAPSSQPADARLRRYWLGVAHYRAGQLEAAQADLSAVHDEDPGFQEVTYYLGKVCQQRGDADRSRTYVREYQRILARRMELRDAEAALRRNIASPEMHVRVARAALDMGDAGRAVFECHTALRMKPGDAAAQSVLREAETRSAG